MQEFEPLKKFLGPLGKPDEGGFSREEASGRGEAVKKLMESKGWGVLMDSIERLQRHEQKTLMRTTPGKAKDEHYERLIGTWAGQDKVKAIAEGIVEYGAEADADMHGRKAA